MINNTAAWKNGQRSTKGQQGQGHPGVQEEVGDPHWQTHQKQGQRIIMFNY